MKLQGYKNGRLITIDLPITDQQWAAYNTGKSTVEKCFPHLTPEQRKFIRNGAKRSLQPTY